MVTGSGPAGYISLADALKFLQKELENCRMDPLVLYAK
jgi:hypothetical protein